MEFGSQAGDYQHGDYDTQSMNDLAEVDEGQEIVEASA